MIFEFVVLVECTAESTTNSTTDSSTYCATNGTANCSTDGAAHRATDSTANSSSKWGNNLFHSNFLLRQRVEDDPHIASDIECIFLITQTGSEGSYG